MKKRLLVQADVHVCWDKRWTQFYSSTAYNISH